MIKKIFCSLSIVLFAATASAQHTSIDAKEISYFSTEEDCLKTKLNCDTVIFAHVKANHFMKIKGHLERYPESISYTYEGLYPIQWAVRSQHKESATVLIKYLASINKLDQIYERGDESGSPDLVSSAYDLDINFVEEILRETGLSSSAKH